MFAEKWQCCQCFLTAICLRLESFWLRIILVIIFHNGSNLDLGANIVYGELYSSNIYNRYWTVATLSFLTEPMGPLGKSLKLEDYT